MKLTERILDLSQLVLSSEQTQVRSGGIHVSSVIRHISKQIGRQKENTFTEADLDKFALVGRLWEAQLAAAMFQPPRYERIGEIEKDGIIGSPDAIDTVDWAVMEFKVTWKSAKRDIAEFHNYWRQIKAYCAMVGCVRAKLAVFYVCGNYSPPVPIAREYSVIFTPAELNDNWAMLQREAQALSQA